MKKFFGFGSPTPPPPAPPSKPPAPPSAPPSAPSVKPANPPVSIVGRWNEPKGTDTTEFHADGTVIEKPASGENIRGRYSLDGSKLKIRLDGLPEEISFTAALKGDTLEMTGPDGQQTRYQRVS